jgi:hypothetical protein
VPTLLLYRFRFRDPVTGAWRPARYVATKEEIGARYASYELLGAPEVREVPDDPQRLSASHLQAGAPRET